MITCPPPPSTLCRRVKPQVMCTTPGVPPHCPEVGYRLFLHTVYKGCPGFSPRRKFLTRKDKESIFTMDHFPLWYRRAAEHPPGSFIYSIVSEEDSGNPSLNTRAEEWGRKSFSHLASRAMLISIPLLPPPSWWEVLRPGLLVLSSHHPQRGHGQDTGHSGKTKLQAVGKAGRAA